MIITVEMFGQLLPGIERLHTLDLERDTSAREVASMLGLKPEEVGLVVINNVQSTMDDILPPDCRLCFFPPMSGG